MRFGSVCSGIEAASVAWHPLGWQAAWLAEIEPFPAAVLAHHYPDVPNLGDMTQLPDMIQRGQVEAPDLFCGGTPCQAFSVAGLRKSLDDARGNLSLVFCEIANAIDTARAGRDQQPAIVFWENVPGVLNTKDNAFGCFLAGLAGETDPLEPPRGRWTNAGVVLGPQRAVAWRILDAQYFGVAQRRRRVFVVASARDGFDPASVLFEFDGLRRDSAPRRETGKATPTLSSSGTGVSRVGFNCQDEWFIAAPVSPTLRASGNQTGGDRPPGTHVDTADSLIVSHTLRGEGFDTSEDGSGRGTPLVPVAFHPTQDPISSADVCHSIGANNNATAAVAITIDEEKNANIDMYGTLQARRESGGFQGAVAVPPAMQVRRLTPVECERLQGFPDGYTAIPWRKKPASECPDGPRYKALGNSWAVPVVRWIGARIHQSVSI